MINEFNHFRSRRLVGARITTLFSRCRTLFACTGLSVRNLTADLNIGNVFSHKITGIIYLDWGLLLYRQPRLLKLYSKGVLIYFPGEAIAQVILNLIESTNDFLGDIRVFALKRHLAS